MSLATRCTSCGTVFRVVQDQLKVSEGWVRCGRCNAVFNALEGLFDLGRDSPERRASGVDPQSLVHDDDEDDVGFKPTAMPPLADDPAPYEPRTTRAPSTTAAAARAAPATTTTATTAAAIAGPQSSAVDAAAEPPASLDELLADPIDAHLFRKRRAEVERAPGKLVDARDRHEFSDARFDSDLFEAPGDDPALIESATSGAGDLPLESETMQPDFLRRADKRPRWRARPLWIAVVVAGVLLLVLQLARQGRDTLAAQLPSLRAALETGCRWTSCRVEAPRRIDAVSVESTGLNRAGEAYALSIALRNRQPFEITLPWIDLSVSDVGGRVLARKMLGPRDFGVAPTLGASGEASLQALVQPVGSAAAARIAGYTVEIFYP